MFFPPTYFPEFRLVSSHFSSFARLALAMFVPRNWLTIVFFFQELPVYTSVSSAPNAVPCFMKPFR